VQPRWDGRVRQRPNARSGVSGSSRQRSVQHHLRRLAFSLVCRSRASPLRVALALHSCALPSCCSCASPLCVACLFRERAAVDRQGDEASKQWHTNQEGTDTIVKMKTRSCIDTHLLMETALRG
jgi:hypothetical protein